MKLLFKSLRQKSNEQKERKMKEAAKWVREELALEDADLTLHFFYGEPLLVDGDGSMEFGSFLPHGWKSDKASVKVRHNIFIPILEYRTLFHEMVHVKQYAEERMIPGYYGEVRWEGNIFSVGSDGDMSAQQYLNLPWEIEAREVAQKLFKRWLWKEFKSWWT